MNSQGALLQPRPFVQTRRLPGGREKGLPQPDRP